MLLKAKNAQSQSYRFLTDTLYTLSGRHGHFRFITPWGWFLLILHDKKKKKEGDIRSQGEKYSVHCNYNISRHLNQRKASIKPIVYVSWLDTDQSWRGRFQTQNQTKTYCLFNGEQTNKRIRDSSLEDYEVHESFLNSLTFSPWCSKR